MSRIALLVALLVALPAWAAHTNIVGTDRQGLFNTVTLTANTESTSAAFTPMARSEAQTIQIEVSSTGTPSLAIVVIGSLDGVTYANPTVGNTPTTITQDGKWLIPVAMPMCSGMKVKVVNTHATSSSTFSVTVSSQ